MLVLLMNKQHCPGMDSSCASNPSSIIRLSLVELNITALCIPEQGKAIVNNSFVEGLVQLVPELYI